MVLKRNVNYFQSRKLTEEQVRALQHHFCTPTEG